MPSVEHDSNDQRFSLNALLHSNSQRRNSEAEYKRIVQKHYDGLAGKLTTLTGMVTGHETLAGIVISQRAFDVRGCKRILDAGCGNGRYTKFILKQADPDAFITAFDLSQRMLRRARRKLNSPRVSHVSADLTHLPYPDGYFDAVVCGWVLEHLREPRHGLRELSRVLAPGGKLLLLTTEDTVTGSMCSRLWHCRTYSRMELMRACEECGLQWARPLYFSKIHRVLRLGGIVVELVKE